MATQYTAGLTTGQVLTAATMNSIGAVAENWTPVVTQPGTIASTITFATYQRIQKMVVVNFRISITGTGTANNALNVTLPIAAKNTLGVAGLGAIYYAAAGAVYNGFGFLSTSTLVSFAGDWANTGVWGTQPSLGITSGSVIWGNFTYEAA